MANHFRTSVGTAVHSSNTGVVIRSEALKNQDGDYISYGNLIVAQVKGKPAMTVWYAHLSARHVKVGEQVAAGQVIGAAGNTGNSRGPHLHCESGSTALPPTP